MQGNQLANISQATKFSLFIVALGLASHWVAAAVQLTKASKRNEPAVLTYPTIADCPCRYSRDFSRKIGQHRKHNLVEALPVVFPHFGNASFIQTENRSIFKQRIQTLVFGAFLPSNVPPSIPFRAGSMKTGFSHGVDQFPRRKKISPGLGFPPGGNDSSKKRSPPPGGETPTMAVLPRSFLAAGVVDLILDVKRRKGLRQS